MDIWFKCKFCSFCSNKRDKFKDHGLKYHPIDINRASYKNAETISGNETESSKNDSRKSNGAFLMPLDKTLSNFSTENLNNSPGKEPEYSENGSTNDKTGILRTLDKNKSNFSTQNSDKILGKEPENSENGSKNNEILQPTSPTAAYVREFEYKCEICMRQFRFKRNLMKHQLVHNKDTSRSKKLDQISDRKSSLRLRVQVVQPKELDKNQNQRNSRKTEPKIVKPRITKSTIGTKLKIIRKKEKHCCQVCDKCFDIRANLEIHKRIHNNDRPYNCQICSKSFIQLSNVQAHSRIHLKEKPYKCTTCNRKFRQLSNLQVHERLHTGVKPYKCHCGVKYSQLSNLREHNKRDHYTSDSI